MTPKRQKSQEYHQKTLNMTFFYLKKWLGPLWGVRARVIWTALGITPTRIGLGMILAISYAVFPYIFCR